MATYTKATNTIHLSKGESSIKIKFILTYKAVYRYGTNLQYKINGVTYSKDKELTLTPGVYTMQYYANNPRVTWAIRMLSSSVVNYLGNRAGYFYTPDSVSTKVGWHDIMSLTIQPYAEYKPPPPPPPKPVLGDIKAPSAGVVTQTQASINWPVVKNAESYQVFVNSVGQGKQDNTGLVISALKPNTSYAVHYVAYLGNTEKKSASITVKTKSVPKPPEQPAPKMGPMGTVTIGVVSQNKASISWSAVQNAEYYVLVVDNVRQGRQSDTSRIVTGLKPNTTYTVKYEAHLRQQGRESPAVTFTTPAAVVKTQTQVVNPKITVNPTPVTVDLSTAYAEGKYRVISPQRTEVIDGTTVPVIRTESVRKLSPVEITQLVSRGYKVEPVPDSYPVYRARDYSIDVIKRAELLGTWQRAAPVFARPERKRPTPTEMGITMSGPFMPFNPFTRGKANIPKNEKRPHDGVVW